jgi:hypothetical protein
VKSEKWIGNWNVWSGVCKVGVESGEREMEWKMDKVDKVEFLNMMHVSLFFLISYEPPSQFCIFTFHFFFLSFHALSYPSLFAVFSLG